MGGFFLLKGKKLYSEIFFNHQMGMAYISFLVQKIAHPQTIYKLVLYHRLLVFAFSLLWGVFFVLRFKWIGLLFILLFESTKYYVFGDRFLAESFIVYPLVYLLALFFYKQEEKAVYQFEYILAGILTWFVMFMREPYIPLALLLYAFLIGKKIKKEHLMSLTLFFSLTGVTLLLTPITDFVRSIFFLNKDLVMLQVGRGGTSGIGILKIFIYPILIVFQGKWTFFRIVLLLLDGVFLLSLTSRFWQKKNRLNTLFLLGILGLASVRFETPGLEYYEAFHTMVWYSMFIFLTLLLLFSEQAKKIKRLALLLYIIVIVVTFFPRYSFFWDKINKDELFTVGYGHYFVTGEVIKTLATPSSTLFLDGYDDLIYWQANSKFSYKYSMYTGLMPSYKPYKDARDDMIKNYPPDFFYSYCLKNKPEITSLPVYREIDYERVLFANKPTCLYVKKSLVPAISQAQKNVIGKFGYSLP